MNSIKKTIKAIPGLPGCYKYFDKDGRLIYIGKAKNLKKRVTSYFVGSGVDGLSRSKDPKTQVLVSNIADIKWEVTHSEIEALVLESILIKKHKPKFNIKIKDDKDFLWVRVDKNQDLPYPELLRRPHMGPSPRGVRYFGPFTDSTLLKEGISILRKLFLWRDCSSTKFSFYKKKGKPCLEYYIKNCSAPCCDYINKNDYQLAIRQLILFLEGKRQNLVKSLQREMKTLSNKKEFERAAKIRDRLRGLEHIGASLSPKISKLNQNNNQIVNKIIDTINKELGYKVVLKDDIRIEFYDISNTSGSNAVGSMIVWQEGEFARDQYRKFKVKYTKGPNDAGMMREILARRMERMSNAKFQISSQIQSLNIKKDNSFIQKPDLIILDGGKPQLSVVTKLFQQLKIDIPLIGLAKQDEEVFGIKNSQRLTVGHLEEFKLLNITKNSPEGFFVQRLRDEAHRFAIGYHKKLREKEAIRSRLDDIEGIGHKTKKKLLLKFGSVDGIIKSDQEEIELLVGEKIARRIREKL